MPKPPFVAKENVERFILSFVHEIKTPDYAEIRNHFGGGSMNRTQKSSKDEYVCTGKEKPFDAGPA